MEVRLEVLASKDPKDNPNDTTVILVAYFTMAARDPITMKAATGNIIIIIIKFYFILISFIL